MAWLCGQSQLWQPTRSTWATHDGHTWARAKNGELSARASVGMGTFQEKLLLVGGHGESVAYMDFHGAVFVTHEGVEQL